MSTDQTAVGDSNATPGGTSDESKDSTKNSTVSREAYEKVLSEAKAAKQRASLLESEKSAAEKAKLEESGQFKELYDKLQSEFEEFKGGSKQREANFAHRTVMSKFREELVKDGCTRPDVVEKMFDSKEFKGSIDLNTFEVNGDEIKKLVEKARKVADIAFAKKAPVVNDVVQKGAQGVSAGGIDAELKACRTQAQFEAVLAKYGKN